MTFDPTDEQAAAIDLAGEGLNLALVAGAGTGKTTTLNLVAARRPLLTFQYAAFNRAVVLDAKAAMPRNTGCHTAHALAFRAVGKHFEHRLDSDRMRSSELARRLRVDPLNVRYGEVTKVIQPSKLAGLAMQTVKAFCNSADAEPGVQHVPWVEGVDEMGTHGERRRVNNDRIAAHVMPAVRRCWEDLSRPDGQLPYSADAYLKVWQLRGLADEEPPPFIPADVILFDEAQDASPVMEDIVRRQSHAQVVVVGDPNQAIYEWRGAVDALSRFKVDARAHLTESFRFGPEIAAVANELLDDLGADIRLTGRGAAGMVGRVDDADAVLCRTNAEALRFLILLQLAGRGVHLVGGEGRQARDLRWFVEDAGKLGAPAKPGKPTPEVAGWGEGASHRDLACFTSWKEVLQYVEDDPQGGELKLWAGLIEEFGYEALLGAIDGVVPEPDADVVVSTAHKSKGREWGRVKLASDYPDDTSVADLRLLYVSCTRAKLALDNRMVPYFQLAQMPRGLR